MKRHLSKLILLLGVALTSSGFAIEKKVLVDVNGMVCAFCSQGITKTFNAQPAVKSVNVDMTKKEVTLVFKDGQDISDAEITKLITDAGVSVDKIVR